MMESLAAIGLAGNIIQFISFSSVLISKSRDIHQSASGVSSDIVDLRLVARDIKTFSDKVVSHGQPRNQYSNIADRCSLVANELLDAISEVQNKRNPHTGQRPPTKWHSFRKALKYVWKKEHIEELRQRLQTLRDQMTMHLVHTSNTGQTRLLDILENWEKRNATSGHTVTNEIRKLDAQLHDIQTRISHICDDDYWTKLRSCLADITFQVQQTSQRHTIIASLRYDYMEIRHDAIIDAHSRTFDWIFHPSKLGPHDPRSRIKYSTWLESSGKVYWVTGKPGSGKSTLMKYLFDHRETIRRLQVWAGGSPLVRVSFYFWISGHQMQKSMEGLLRTMLYHLLQACPNLIPLLCSPRWSTSTESPEKPPTASWTLTELQNAFAIFKEQHAVATKFYFHIDGLDEYNGESWDIIAPLKDLATCPHVKLCLSSRPWNAFHDAFGQLNPDLLRLHDLTQEDIELFARESLQSCLPNMEYSSYLFDDLIHDIRRRAQGVFLWVRLAVRSLRDGIANEDPLPIIHERLRAIPTDLEEFFELMLESVDVIYRPRMAHTFITALRSDEPLNVIQHYFLEHDHTIDRNSYPIMQWPTTEIQRKVHQTQRRLNGRFKGLLEPSSIDQIGPRTTVDFLHRTLRDFIQQGQMRKTLEAWAPSHMNPLLSISRALIAEASLIEEFPRDIELRCAVAWASEASFETGDTTAYFKILDQVEYLYERLLPKYLDWPSGTFMLRAAASTGRADYLCYRLAEQSLTVDPNRILKHAIDLPLGSKESFDDYMMWEPCWAGVNSLPGPLFQDKMCKDPSILATCPSVAVVKLLIDNGADPTVLFNGFSALDSFLGRLLSLIDGDSEEDVWEIFQVVLNMRFLDVKHGLGLWWDLLTRPEHESGRTPRNTLRYFKSLFAAGMKPDIEFETCTGTAFVVLLRSLVVDTTSSACGSGPKTYTNELLKEFLSHGADVSQVDSDPSGHGWLSYVQCELLDQTTTVLRVTRVKELRIFLEYGLNLNSLVPHRETITMWACLLQSIVTSLYQTRSSRSYQQVVCDITVLCLSYGADPHIEDLAKFLRWLGSCDCALTRAEVLEVRHAVDKELAHVDAQSYSSAPRIRSVRASNQDNHYRSGDHRPSGHKRAFESRASHRHEHEHGHEHKRYRYR
ncbi:hypothetical protein FB567DRAFT_633084 [Paraphoma chrysanthemicola]|uniref:Peptidase A2 domain-containing protein n=1 Tax=Paraphoma chrysanthemicola TaxID=798071 RepID=A0A8K0QV74_9PLEO|nr:hypothetical protein FB567DRAFT_633084 [Paraphoma chrysanthemicola]